jgi:hypothetical protein
MRKLTGFSPYTASSAELAVKVTSAPIPICSLVLHQVAHAAEGISADAELRVRRRSRGNSSSLSTSSSRV